MAGSEVFRNEKGALERRKTSSAEDVASAEDTARLQSAAGLGSMEKKGRGPMPKPSAGETMMSPAFRERLRTWNAGPPDDAVVSKAMEKLERK